jgi:DNA-binding NarL/FixJ family response regulator
MISVLLAEDNAAYRRLLCRLLGDRFPFLQITEAADGIDALHQALSRHYDVIFMDIRLPQGNGLDLTRAIKAACTDSMVCVTTGFDLPEYRDAAFRQGADRFLVKGDSTGDDIVAMVQSLLASRFRTLILVRDALSRKQLTMLLSIHWPAMILAEAAHFAEGIGKAAALKPDLVLLELALAEVPAADMVNELKACSGEARFVGLVAEDEPAAEPRVGTLGVDYVVPLDPAGHTELVAIMNALLPSPEPKQTGLLG